MAPDVKRDVEPNEYCEEIEFIDVNFADDLIHQQRQQIECAVCDQFQARPPNQAYMVCGACLNVPEQEKMWCCDGCSGALP